MNQAALAAISPKRGWTPRPLKAFLVSNDSGVWGADPIGGAEDTVVLRSTDVALDGGWRIEDPAVRSLAPLERKASALRRGDLVVVKSSGSQAHLGKVALVTDQVEALAPSFSNFMQRLRPSSNCDPRYLWYLLNSRLGREQMVLMGTTSTGLQNLNGGILGSVICPGPPLAAQRAIADYLDTEVARIENLVDAYKRLASVSIDRTASTIAHQFNGPTVRLKHLVTKIGSGKTPLGGATTYVDEGIAFIRSMNVRYGNLDMTELAHIDPVADADMASTRLQGGDVLLNITGASIGRSSVVPANLLPANVNQHVCILRPQPGVPSDLLCAALLTPDVQMQIQSVQVGGNRDGLTFEQVAGLLVRWPDHSGLDRLGREVRMRMGQGARLATRIDSQISLLIERRQALITAAVTGSLEIPGIAA